MDQLDPIRLTFDDVVIDVAGRRLLRGGVEQPLEPKAFGVLALLAGSPGRVFTRDEILDAVWNHRHVTPGVLNRVMTLLRHALGEDAQNPCYLHTVHGVGYRFDLPREEAKAVPMAFAVDADAHQPPESATTGLQRHAGDRVLHGAPWRRHLLWLVPLLAAVIIAAWHVWPRNSPRLSGDAATAPATPPTLVVMPLKPIGAGDGVRILAEGLGEELIGMLAQIEGLRVIARESTLLAAAESTDPSVLAKRLGISHVLQGSLQQHGQHLRIHLRLIDASTGSAQWAKDFDRDASEVLQLQRDIAQQVADSLTLKLGLTARPTKSGDADFLRRYLAAKTLLERTDLPPEQSTELAESELRGLLRERPDDARSHASLSVALYLRSIRRPSLPSVPTLRDEALHEAAVARQLDPSLAEPYMVLSTAACNTHDWERCLALKSRARALGGRQDNVLGYAYVLAQLGYLDRAESTLREIIAHDPINTQPHFVHGRLLDTLGLHDEAHRVFERHRSPNDVYGRWFNAVWRHDYGEAARIAQAEIGAPDSPDAYGALLKPGYVAASRALADPKLWPQARSAARTFEQETGLMNFIDLLAPDAPTRAAELIGKLQEIGAKGYSSWDLLLWTKDMPWLRRDPAFQAYLRDNGILAYWRKHGFPRQCRPQGDGAYCE